MGANGSRRRTYPPVPSDCPLQPRELAIVRMLADGMTRLEVARELDMSHVTVQVAISRARRTLGARTDGAAVRLARRWVDSPRLAYRYPPVPPGCPLTPHELAVLRRLAAGDAASRIAFDLGLTQGTTYAYLQSTRRKLGLVGAPLHVVCLHAQEMDWLREAAPLDPRLTPVQHAYCAAVDRWLREATESELLFGECPGDGPLSIERAAIGRALRRDAGKVPRDADRPRPSLAESLARASR